jgi:hypothetical protein
MWITSHAVHRRMVSAVSVFAGLRKVSKIKPYQSRNSYRGIFAISRQLWAQSRQVLAHRSICESA